MPDIVVSCSASTGESLPISQTITIINSDDERLLRVVRILQHNCQTKRNADTLIRVRDGQIVEIQSTDIQRFGSLK